MNSSTPDKSPAFLFYTKDFLMDERVVLMSMAARGVYITLICHCWNEGSIPCEMEKLARMCPGMDGSAMAQLWPELERCFELRGDRYVQPQLERERQKQHARSQERSDSGSKGAQSRWLKQRNEVGKQTKEIAPQGDQESASDNGSAITPGKAQSLSDAGSAIAQPMTKEIAEPLATDSHAFAIADAIAKKERGALSSPPVTDEFDPSPIAGDDSESLADAIRMECGLVELLEDNNDRRRQDPAVELVNICLALAGRLKANVTAADVHRFAAEFQKRQKGRANPLPLTARFFKDDFGSWFTQQQQKRGINGSSTQRSSTSKLEALGIRVPPRAV